jgi:hypothetical protein
MVHVRRVLQSPEVVAAAIIEVQRLEADLDKQRVIEALQSIEVVWDELFPLEQARIVQLLVDRVTISTTGIQIDMKTLGMNQLLNSIEPQRRAA